MVVDLKTLIEYEKLIYVTINPLPVDIDPDSTLEEREPFDRWKVDNLKVKSYIFGSMVPNLLIYYIEVLYTWSIMWTLKELFEENQVMELYRRSKELFRAELKEGGAIIAHILNMIV